MVTKFDSDGQLDLLVVNSPVSGICMQFFGEFNSDGQFCASDRHTDTQTDRHTLNLCSLGQALIGANATHHIVDGVSKRLITMHKVYEKQ